MPDETVDLPTRVDALEQRVNPVEAMTEVATAIRADMATIAEGVDPTLAQPWPSSSPQSRITACCWPGYSTTSSGPSWGTRRPPAYGTMMMAAPS
jgi:hypothetical protein